MAFILRNINNKSLAIIDELGRGTSTRDGLAIAIAMAEALVQCNALVLFATHFTDLAHVLEDRPGVLNLHLAAETTMAEGDIPKMTMLYKIGSGPVQEQNYGISLARAIGFPQRFLDLAEDVTDCLKHAAEAKRQSSDSRRLARRRKLVLNLRETLQQACDGDMDDEPLRSYLQRLQREFVRRMEEIEGVDEAGEADEEDEEEDATMDSARGTMLRSVIVLSSDDSAVDEESSSTVDHAHDSEKRN